MQSIKVPGTLSNCIGVDDVSGNTYAPAFSDGTTTLGSSLGLSILLAEVVEPPFNNAVISFSYTPQIFDLTDSTLEYNVKFIKKTGVGYNTDFAKLMRTVLREAVKAKLKPEQMNEMIFIFSDMEFDMTSPVTPWTRWTSFTASNPASPSRFTIRAPTWELGSTRRRLKTSTHIDISLTVIGTPTEW